MQKGVLFCRMLCPNSDYEYTITIHGFQCLLQNISRLERKTYSQILPLQKSTLICQGGIDL